MKGCISYVFFLHSFLGKKQSSIPKELFNQLYGSNGTDTALEKMYEITVKILNEAILHSQPF